MPHSALLTDLYELTMAGGYFEENQMPRASFELSVRHLPRNRNYLVAAGLEQVIHYLKNWHFTDAEIDYLKRHPSLAHLPARFFKFLKKMKFTGDLWAIPEGTVAFANEPILRLTAPLPQAQILETCLLSMVSYQTMIATKTSRMVGAARGRDIIEFGARRAPSPEASLSAARASYIGGAAGTSNTLAGEMFGIPTYGTQAHSWIMAFENEEEAFEKYFEVYPESTILLIDTYDAKKAIHKAVRLGKKIRGVRIDSGNITELSKYCRKVLDEHGLKQTKIIASGNLDEYKITRLLRAKAPIDIFGVGTELVVSGDAPALNTAYKLVAVGTGRKKRATLKLSPFKKTYAGEKQVFRALRGRGPQGLFKKDILALANEPTPKGYRPLLKMVMKGGKRYGKNPKLSEIRKYAEKEIASLPEKFHALDKQVPSPVQLSRKLEQMTLRRAGEIL